MLIKSHPLIKTLLNLKGNPRACVYTEPLWGIPYNLFIPYASIYMIALGLKDSQIGLIASISMAAQIVFGLLSGIITDKLGRLKTTFYCDFLAWSIPCLIWAFSSSFVHFVIAAVINSTLRISMNSWGCLLVEDCDKEEIVNIYTWIYISGQIVAFAAPLSGFFIGLYGIVPTVRAIYLLAFAMMTFKFIILNKFATETRQGKIRMEATKNQSVLHQMNGYGKVLAHMLKTPETMLTLGIILIMNIISMVNGTFWSILVTERIHLPTKILGIFPFIRSFVMLIFFFTVVPRIRAIRFKRPLLLGFSIYIASQVLLITAPDQGYLSLVISVLLEACSLSLISPLLDSMQVIMVDPKERARIIAILYVIVMALSSPFGWIAGVLSGMNHSFPFIMNIFLLITGIVLTLFASMVAGKSALIKQAEEGTAIS